MLSENIYEILKKCAWILFFVLLILSIANLVLSISENFFHKTLPLKIDNGIVVQASNDSLVTFFNNKIITKVDTQRIEHSTAVLEEKPEEEENDLTRRFILGSELNHGIQVSYNEDFERVSIDSVEIVFVDTLTNIIGKQFIKVDKKIDKLGILGFAGNFALIIFAFFNAFLLLKYSSSRENILIVFFVLFLITPSPNLILGKSVLYIWTILLSPFWGVLFYHFMALKAGIGKNCKKLYIASAIIFFIGYIASILIKESFDFIHIWSAYWMFKGFLLLRKEYRKSRSIELKRLWGAFSGIGISMISIILIFILAVVIGLFAGISNLTGLSMLIKSYSEFLGIFIAILVLIPILGIFLGFLWFLGSFTWSLLTGTVMGLKIRSTLISTITGVVFVIVFGLVDYSLGEILQSLFGKFVGSEFIAGIPVTIGMITLFNPVRSKIEKLVDSKLNTSELDFLEKTESFTNNISEEGVLEGFEEYICKNLILRLKLNKVALISYDSNLKAYKFNEIRGSDVIENSIVDDVHLLLLENRIQTNNKAVNENPQEISSFSMIIPIINDPDHKWFLALGKKADKSLYNKKDELALVQLTDRIKLSLKFILAYEDIVNKKYQQTISKHEEIIKEKDHVIRMLKKELNGISI
ncbi:MAG: hypothetical protein P9L95_10555 [Candidatus Tenebribacter mawsonii]|nr:hypothetical protein [Candidatus Tenebribacter mawsonii]